MSTAPESTAAAPLPVGEEKDASTKSIIYYAIGNIENGLANQFYNILSIITVVALGMSPLLIGLIISLKTIFEAITDPAMAHITDNARTRWGRRIPFILFGGISRCLLVFALFLFFPHSDSIKSNQAYQQEKAATEAAEHARLEASSAAAQHKVEPSASKPAPQATLTETAISPSDTPPLPKPSNPKPIQLEEKIKSGFRALTSAENSHHKHVFYYLLVFSLGFALLSSVGSVPYYALGMEIAPSYDGRTKVVTYRSYADKAMSIVAGWILPFCFLPIFVNVFEGLVWYGVVVCAVGIPATIAMCYKVKEPAYTKVITKGPKPPLFTSMWQTARSIHFLKILFLYVFIGFTNGIFVQVSTFLVLYWVFAGDMLHGTVLNSYAGTLGIALAIGVLPLIQWACRRFSKHDALRAAIVWMAVGAAMKWFCITPKLPYLTLVLPFFFSIGISSVYTILPSLMADVTDVDELQNGVRREGMFGAVMAFLMKALGSLQPVLAAVVLTVSGFDASLGVAQPEEVIHRMRLMASWVPASLLLLALVALWRYPLTREYMMEVKAQLVRNRAAKAAKA